MICQRRLNENGFNPSEVNGVNSISRKINESLFALDYKRLPRTVDNSCGCIDVSQKNVNVFIKKKNGKTKQKYLLLSCRWMEPEWLIALLDLSIIATLWGAASRWECRCVKSVKVIFVIAIKHLPAKPAGLWVYVAHTSTHPPPKKKKNSNSIWRHPI